MPSPPARAARQSLQTPCNPSNPVPLGYSPRAYGYRGYRGPKGVRPVRSLQLTVLRHPPERHLDAVVIDTRDLRRLLRRQGAVSRTASSSSLRVSPGCTRRRPQAAPRRRPRVRSGARAPAPRCPGPSRTAWRLPDLGCASPRRSCPRVRRCRTCPGRSRRSPQPRLCGCGTAPRRRSLGTSRALQRRGAVVVGREVVGALGDARTDPGPDVDQAPVARSVVV